MTRSTERRPLACVRAGMGMGMGLILLAGFGFAATAQAQSWTRVATEGGSFTVTGTQTVRYGAGSSWLQLGVSGTVPCTNAFFGADPIYGVAKECDLLNTGATATTTALASSINPSAVGQSTTLSATVTPTAATGSVTFQDGATTLGTGTLSAGIATYAASFATPGSHSLSAVYAGDTGYAASTSAALTQTVSAATGTWTRVATEGGSFTVTGTQTVRYGAGSSWLQLGVSGTVPCTNAFFGADPIYGVAKECDLLASSSVPLPTPPVSPVPVATYEYDAQGNPTRTIQAPGSSGFAFATTHTYDALNRQKDSTDARNGQTRFGYDGLDRTVQVTDPRNLVTQTPRNGLGDATSLVSPDTGTASNTYDASGNLKTRTDSRGVLATYSHDALNRLTGIVHSQSGQTSLAHGWTYDQSGAGFSNGIGRLTSTTHPAGSTRYAYDPQGRLLTDTQRVSAASGANSAQVSATVGYGYDAAGHATSITYPSGRVLGIAYTGGKPSAITLARDGSSTPTTLIDTIQWEPFGGVTGWNWQLAAGAKANTRVYDSAGRMIRYQLGNAVRDITYDAGDRITTYTHHNTGSGATTPALDQGFGYDELGRLTGITTATAHWTIGYDANGNRTGVTLNGSTSSYTTEATSNRLSGLGNPARSFGYDSAGNTTSDSANYTSSYDLAGRLATLTKAGTTVAFTLDGMGRRVRKFISAGTGAGSASTVIFVYGQNSQLLGEYDSTGAAIREYVWLGTTPVAVFTPDPANADNPPIVYFVHTDHLDTPRVVVDKNNNVRWRWMAEPFGTTAPETNPSGLGQFSFPLRFPGQYADAETGLNYNYFRDYDPDTGRYVQSDPIGLAGGINTYAYVGGNPLSYTDPRGLDAQCGPGQVAVSDPRNPGGQVFICRPHSTEPPDKPICVTPECAGGVLPTPAPPSDNAQCQFKCNVKYQPICTVAGVGTGVLTTPLGGAAAGGSCVVVKYLVCRKVCKDRCEPDN